MHGTEYQKLNSSAKDYYDAIYENASNYASDFTFSNVEFKFVTGIFRAVRHDNPGIFWYTNSIHGQTRTCGGRSEVTMSPELLPGVDKYQIMEMEKRLRNAVRGIAGMADHKLSVFDRVLFVHDYLVDNTDYVPNAPDCYDAYGCLINKRAVCSGYSAAFQLILQQLGIECGRVSGTDVDSYSSDADHEWNYVRLPDAFYFVDVTWDDPRVENIGSADNKTHDYFCLSEQELRRTHRISDEYNVPYCAGGIYNYYTYYRLYAGDYDFSSVKNIAVPQLQREDKFTVKFSSPVETAKAVRELITDQGVYRIPGVSDRISYSKSRSGLILSVANKQSY